MKTALSVSLFLTLTINVIAQPTPPFIYGVASGDPLADFVIIWTKLLPADTTQPVTVNWRIAADTGFSQIINSGSVTTDSSSEFTVKADVPGLQPGTWYYYDFETGGNYSLRGRTKTAPAGAVSNVRFAVATCAKFSKGYFNAYESIAERNDIDAVIHLGDYIYESNGSNDDIRPFQPDRRCETLYDYRTRYKQYHSDPNLIEARQLFPWINVWDDHETGNDCWMNGSEHWPDSADFALIKQAATKTYFEWMPIRQDTVNPWRFYRKFQYGDLIDLIMLDTRREGRQKQYPFADSNKAIINDTNRTILGHEQYTWLIANLDNSTAQWRIIGQQVMMAPALLFGQPLNEDQWDGYPAERAKLFSHIMGNQIDNVVVLTGDFHASFANDLPQDINQYEDATGAGSVAVEFVTPAIASSESDFGGVPFSIVKSNDPHVQYADFTQRGYIILDVTEEKVQGDFYYVSTINTQVYTDTLAASLHTLAGTRHFYREPTAINEIEHQPLFEIHPNPVREMLSVRYESNSATSFRIYDLEGKLMKEFPLNLNLAKKNSANLNIGELATGTYIIKMFTGQKEMNSSKFVVAD